MATTFNLGKVSRSGEAPIFVNVQDHKSKTHVYQKTGLSIVPKIWEKRDNEKFMDKYRNNPDVQRVLLAVSEIRFQIDARFARGEVLGCNEVRSLVGEIVYKEQIEEEKARKAEAKRREEEANRMTLDKFIDVYLDDLDKGRRVTDSGKVYGRGTLKTIRNSFTTFRNFEKKVGHVYDFDEIDMIIYRDFLAYLNECGYAVNTTGKTIKALKALMAVAESEGYHTNTKYKDKRFKGTMVDVDSIYLTKEDLAKMAAVDLSGRSYGFELARDIFFVGVWTAQRVSDYNNIHKEDIETYTKRTIVDVPDPEHPGQTIATVQTKEITVINIRQHKTGAKVAIPCSTALKAILEKYDYNIPHLSDQNINDNIKEVARLAGLTEKVPIVTTKGGKPVKEMVEKYKLVHSHTARRTGATLMYLAGMEIYDIMKITGHATPKTLKKYIKADELEVVDKITDKYTYFD